LPPDKRHTPPSVLICAGNLGGGGVQSHLTLLCRLLRRHGAGVTLVGSDRGWPAQTLSDLRSDGVNLRLPPAAICRFAKLRSAFAAAAAPLWGRGDFTSLCNIGEGRLQLLFRKWVSRRTVSIYHEIVDDPRPDNLRGRCALAADAVIANSAVVQAQFTSQWPRMPVRVIPFLTASAVMPVPKPRPPIGDRPLRMTYLGRIVGHKRPHDLVRRWRQLTAAPPLASARLDVYGYDPDGRFIAEMRETIATEKLGDRITLHGAYEPAALDSILAQSDVVVLPSWFEGLPLSLVEAMQRGVPIVACAAGGVAEFADGNPDVVITSTNLDDFDAGLATMAAKLRAGQIDAVRLHHWAESRYGYETVSKLWLDALLRPREFWNIP
jgi:glycosyltransferase involved in cell wall biosynthesis